MKYICSFFALVLSIAAHAQKFTILTQGTPTNLRGLSCNNKEVWASGSNGTVGHSTDGGANWLWTVIPGYEKVEFRDVEALGNHTALLMGISAPAYILKTSDGGKHWKKVYENRDTAMFLDAMAFKNTQWGCVIGDPVHGKFFFAETRDGGNTWKHNGAAKLPAPVPGEAFFAASGTNITFSDINNTLYLVSGGSASKIYTTKRSQAERLPLSQGTATTGANGIAVLGNKIMIAGGDFAHPDRTDSSFIYSNDNGFSWQKPITPPNGYRSCVCAVTKDIWVTCGITGVDITYDGGANWKQVSTEIFNTCTYNKKDKMVIVAGTNGKVGKILL